MRTVFERRGRAHVLAELRAVSAEVQALDDGVEHVRTRHDLGVGLHSFLGERVALLKARGVVAARRRGDE